MRKVNLRSVEEAEISGKRVLVRADLDVPLYHGAVADDWRLKAIIPTLELLSARGAATITLIGHCGRPGGKVDEALRIAPVEKRLRELTQLPLEVKENLRFDPREEANDQSFAQELAKLGDVYVNEAFANCHRAHASMVGVPKLLPSFAGLRLLEEAAKIEQATAPEHPALAVIGGAKFETKEPLLAKLAQTYDKVLVGGVLGNDLLKSRGFPVGASMVGKDIAPTALASEGKLYAPEDLVVTDNKEVRASNTSDVRSPERIVDIGSRTAEAWGKEIESARFVLWNGPVGLYEGGFVQGTDTLAIALTHSAGFALVGGGDTIAAIAKYSFDPKKVFLSTGGGAMLQFLTEGTLPALEVLKK